METFVPLHISHFLTCSADAMYLCYHIDLQAGAKHRADVFEAVSYSIPRMTLAVYLLMFSNSLKVAHDEG